jgi:hypothetical protein
MQREMDDCGGRLAWAFTSLWAAGMIMRVMECNDIDEARAAAEHLAEERG